jgi:hypothetical protein
MKALKGELAKLLLSFSEGKLALLEALLSKEDIKVTLPNGKGYTLTKEPRHVKNEDK